MLAGVLYDLSPALCFLLQAAVCLLGAPLLRGIKEPVPVPVEVGP
jgi:hypothetical protein